MTRARPTVPSLPRFDRNSFGERGSLTRLGDGRTGGKATGLALTREILHSQFDHEAGRPIQVQVPTMVVLTTEVFDVFLKSNGLDEVVREDAPDDRIAHAFQKAQFPVEIVGDLRALIAQVHTPLAIRSSSLLEDALYRPFAGVYGTKMIPNNQPDADTRFRRLIEAIKFVWASTYFGDAKSYIRATDQSIADEKMAVVIQEVVGRRHDNRFYPEISGVARSYDFYPFGATDPAHGVVNLALGLGKTIVDGGLSWTYSPGRPRAAPPFASVKDMLKSTQTEFWAVNMGKAPAHDPIREAEYLLRVNLADAEMDDTLRYVASTYDAASDRLTIGVGNPGPRALNFAPILTLEEIPLNGLIRSLLRNCEDALGGPVEIEFAVTSDAIGQAPTRFGFLQLRPMVVSDETVDVTVEEMTSPDALVASESIMGNGVQRGITDVVYVKPASFEARHTRTVAQEVASINNRLLAAKRPYILIGFGRWGSADPWLGIPVSWGEICGARAIVEATRPEMNVDPSQGSHFFHNISSFGVGYFAVHHDRARAVDWSWLERQPTETETDFVRHVHTSAPLVVKLDGRARRGVILTSEPGSASRATQ